MPGTETWLSLGRRWAAAMMVLAAASGCEPHEALPPSDVCQEVGRAIASRVFSCSGDVARAEKLADRLAKEYSCIPKALGAIENGMPDTRGLYACPFQISGLACEQVKAFGDDLGRWARTVSSRHWGFPITLEQPNSTCRLAIGSPWTSVQVAGQSRIFVGAALSS